MVLYEGEQSQLRLLQPQEDLKYIIIVPHNAPCLFATVDFQGDEEPKIIFYSEEAVGNGRREFIYKGPG